MSTPAKGQIDKFRKAARQLEADEDDGRFENRLRQIVKERQTESEKSPARKGRPK